MSQVDFHLLEEQDTESVMLYTCRLVNKAYRLGHRLYIKVMDSTQAERLDKLLWSFSDLSFIPHSISDSETATAASRQEPVLIGIMDAEVDSETVLINLTDTIPDNYVGHARIIEVVSNDEHSRNAARLRFRQYRDMNNQLNSHKIGN